MKVKYHLIEKELTTIKKDNKYLRDKLGEIENTVDFIEKDKTSTQILLKAEKYIVEDPICAVVDIASKLNVSISKSDIISSSLIKSYSINDKNGVKHDKNIIKYTLVSDKVKHNLLRNKRNLLKIDNLKHVQILDSLSRKSIDILQYAQSLRNFGYKSIYSSYGKVYAKETINTKPILLNTKDVVDQLIIKSNIKNVAIKPAISNTRPFAGAVALLGSKTKLRLICREKQ